MPPRREPLHSGSRRHQAPPPPQRAAQHRLGPHIASTSGHASQQISTLFSTRTALPRPTPSSPRPNSPGLHLCGPSLEPGSSLSTGWTALPPWALSAVSDVSPHHTDCLGPCPARRRGKHRRVPLYQYYSLRSSRGPPDARFSPHLLAWHFPSCFDFRLAITSPPTPTRCQRTTPLSSPTELRSLIVSRRPLARPVTKAGSIDSVVNA